MFDGIDLDDLKQRGFIGAISCSASGGIMDATSDDLEVFGSILGFVSQMADMIGEPFGMDSLDEVHIVSAQTLAVCIPQVDGALGVLCSSRANVEQILADLIN